MRVRMRERGKLECENEEREGALVREKLKKQLTFNDGSGRTVAKKPTFNDGSVGNRR